MYKLFDWKTVLFWHTYYGYWMYLRFKNGRPGEIVVEEDDIVAPTLANKTVLGDNKVVEGKGIKEKAKLMTEFIASTTRNKEIEMAAENQNQPLVSAVPAIEDVKQVEQQVEPMMIEELEEFSMPTDLKALLQKVSYDIEEVLKNV